MAAISVNAENSPYIARVYDYLPAPGQFVNTMPAYKPGYTQDSINAIVEAALCGKANGSTISLGSFGGYIVFGFDHPVVNKHDYDVRIYGNAFQSNAVPDMAGGSCEPGIIMVGVDMDGNGVPSDGDLWYEIKGSSYDSSMHGFEVTYYKPDEDKPKVPHEKWSFINDIEYVHWTSNDPDAPEGYVWRNTFHNQPYWPLWIEDTVMTLRGTKLPNLSIDMTANGAGTSWFQPFFGEGYVDNLPNAQEPGFKIDWAIDEDGNPVELDHIDFIKVYCGQLDYCGWLGEVSTEVCGAEDLHPDAEPDTIGPGPGDFTFTNGVIFVNEDRYGPNQGSLNYYNYDYDEMEYNVYAMVNPDEKLGVTTQFGQLFGDRLFLVSKQANASEASGNTMGSRLAVLDAATLKQQGSILRFGPADSIYDGRAYCAVTANKGYVSTSAGIFVIDVPTMSVTGYIDGTMSSAKGDYNSLYKDQCGDMVRFGQYVFAVQQGHGLHVIDPVTDQLEATLAFPDIVTVFVTAGGNLYVANNSREIYDYSGGPYVANFTRINPVSLAVEEVFPLDGTHGALSSWGAWRARMVCADPHAERVYYNYDEYQNHISSYDFATHSFTDELITLPDGVEINWDGTLERQGLYAAAISFDPHTGDMVVQTIEAAPMSYQNFNHNWVLFYDANTLELKRQVRLRDAYWFPAMAVYPDVSDPVVTIADRQLPQGQTEVIDLLAAVADADNMAALAVTTAQSANPQIARAWVSGTNLHIMAVAPGQTTVDVTTDSNGKLATSSFTVTVSKVSLKGDVNMDGHVDISDVTELINILLGSVLCNYDPAAADYNSDGTIDISDVTMLINYLLYGV